MTSIVVWEHENLRTASSESSNKITLVCKKIQSPIGSVIRSISSRHTGTLVCCQDGSVHCCTYDPEHPATESILTNLAHVKGLQRQKVIHVAAGASHNVILTEDHRVHTWQKKDCGQLGRDASREKKDCGQLGRDASWEKNDCGQLGRDASRKYRGRPKLVQSLASHRVLQISCGSSHTLALSDDGLVFAWGSNNFGQLGLGKSISQQNLPEVVSSLKGIPVMLLTTGSNHSFLLSKSGSVYGWGKNDCGQLGVNNTENSDMPKKCRILNDKTVKHICCGENHTACLTKNGSVFTFGAGSDGQLGHGSDSNETTPKQVMQLSGCEVSQIACGSNHTLAYVPQCGRLHLFGFGGNGHFSMMEEENENGHISLSGCFDQISNNQSSTLCMPIDKKKQPCRIKTIQAGGNHSFITVVAAKQTCDADDFRNEDPSKQILTLSQEKINMLLSLNPEATPSNEIEKIFSSASCLNSSFLLPNEEHYESSSKKHGVDMNAVQEFFQNLAGKPNIMKFIHDKIEKHLIPQLPPSSLDGEAIRLYLMLPKCDLFDKPEFNSSLICQFAKSFLGLDDKARNIFSSWCKYNQASFFKQLVVIFKQCAQYLLQLPCSANSREGVKRNKELVTCLNMLKWLHQVNEVHNIIDASMFIVPDLKDMVDVQKDYITLHLKQMPEENAEVFNQCAQCLLRELNLSVADEERRRNDAFLACFKMFPKLKQDLNFSNYPFLFDGEMKGILYQTDAKLQMLTAQVCQTPANTMPSLIQNTDNYYFYLCADRQNVVNGIFTQLYLTDTTSLKKPLSAQFIGEKAAGDGVKKEFFRLLFEEAMDSAFGLFTADGISKLMWFNTMDQEKVEECHLIGILCGLVIYNSVAIDLHFPLAMYKKLLKKPVNLDDVKELVPEVARCFQEILDYDGDDFEDLFSLTFEYAANELCPDGASRAVTQSNKKVYVNLAVDFILNKSVELQFAAFGEGFHAACGGKILSNFQPKELRSLVEGNEDYDFSELEKNTSYKHGYVRKHPTINFFWKVFHEMSLANKKKFLLFLTGSDRISITGMKNIRITIQPREEKDGMLPFAFTCHKLLSLPRYKTQEELKEKLLVVIHQTEGFWLFPD